MVKFLSKNLNDWNELANKELKKNSVEGRQAQLGNMLVFLQQKSLIFFIKKL